MAGPSQQLLAGFYGPSRMLCPRHSWDEDPDDLVADELVDKSVVLNQDADGVVVEAAH